MKEIKDCSYYYDCCSCGGNNDCGCPYCYDCNRCEVCEELDKEYDSADIDYLKCNRIKQVDR